MATDIRLTVKKCKECTLTGHESSATQLQACSEPTTTRPWERVSVDFSGPYTGGKYTILLIDSYSRFPEAKITNAVTSQTAIGFLEEQFARYGVPDMVKTDNGPAFASKEFAEFLSSWGARHHVITPYRPQANGEVESVFRMINKAIRIAKLKKQEPERVLREWLYAYRRTPHPATLVPPGEMIFRATQTDFVRLHKNSRSKAQRETIPPHKIRVGDVVTRRKWNPRKDEPPWEDHKYVVTNVKWNVITLKDANGALYKRHVSDVKLLPSEVGGEML